MKQRRTIEKKIDKCGVMEAVRCEKHGSERSGTMDPGVKVAAALATRSGGVHLAQKVVIMHLLLLLLYHLLLRL